MTILGYVILIYLLLGLLFAIAFAAKGCKVLDDGADTSGLAFRLIIVPASLLLWPHLLQRWLGARSEKGSSDANTGSTIEGHQHD
jgi:hypothetical protein